MLAKQASGVDMAGALTLGGNTAKPSFGGDTHRDSHALDMAAPTGAKISTLEIVNDPSGYAEAVEWIAHHAPGPRVIVGVEGTRSYGVGLPRALQAAGPLVVEVERPRRADRRRGGI